MAFQSSTDQSDHPFLEIAIFNSSSAYLAYTSSADRLELCAEGSCANGGTTPSLSTLQAVIASLQRAQADTSTRMKKAIPIYAMIRPRGGDFVYSDQEFDLMKEQLLALKAATYYEDKNTIGEPESSRGFGRVNGFVFGILTNDNKVDRARNEELVRLAAPLPCTFHRAFDEVITSVEYRSSLDGSRHSSGDNSNRLYTRSSNTQGLLDGIVDELEALIKAGFASILTSGGRGRNAFEGSLQIAALTDAANSRIAIIAGGGVRSTNVRELRRKSPRTLFYHSSAIVGNGDIASQAEVLALKKELITPLS